MMQMPQDSLAIKARLGIVSQFDSLDPDFRVPKTCWSLAATSVCRTPPYASASRACWNSRH